MFMRKKSFKSFLVAIIFVLLFPPTGLAIDQSDIQMQSQMDYRVKNHQNTASDKNIDDAKVKREYHKYQSDFYTQGVEQVDLTKVNDRRIVVKWLEGKIFDATKYGLIPMTVSGILKDRNIYLVKVPETIDYKEILQELKNDPDQISVEPDYLTTSSYIPADSGFSKQWYLSRIDLPKAWDITKGSADVTIAVLDTGIKADHPEFRGRLLPGYDFVNHDADPSDDNGHGTLVAGIIAASPNQSGIVGIDLNAKILPVKVSNRQGNGSVIDAVSGIYYAIERGADVINMSYSSYEYSEVEATAIAEAHSKGIVLVAAAGNDGGDNWSYPASYKEVISVASTNNRDEPSTFSNSGDFIDLAAPGEDIIGPSYMGGYQVGSGTSFSAPIVSGIAGLILAEHRDWNPAQIEWAMELTGANIVAGNWNPNYGFGRVNAYGALTVQLPSLADESPDTSEKAEPIDVNQVVTDRINMPMDDDWYTFDISKQADVTIQLSNFAEYLNVVGILFKKDGGQLVESQVIDDYDSGENETYSVRLDAGTYYLVVYDFYNHWSTEEYQLEILAPSLAQEDSDDQDTPIFPDIVNHWARVNIEKLARQGFIFGYPDGSFGPNDMINRASTATLIGRVLGLQPDPEAIQVFSDVPSNHWASGYIGAVTKAGIMIGDENGLFQPDSQLTREEMAAVLVRVFQLTGTSTKTFSDVSAKSWSYPYVEKLVANNIAYGYPDGTFRPRNSITRAEFATMVERGLELE